MHKQNKKKLVIFENFSLYLSFSIEKAVLNYNFLIIIFPFSSFLNAGNFETHSRRDIDQSSV